MKVECIAIVKDYTTADVRAQQFAEDAFAQMDAQVVPFRVLDDTKSFFKEMGEMFRTADVIVAAADENVFLEQKWNMLKALGAKSEICPAVISVIREEVSAPDTSAKAHALMPKDAAVFLTSDGLFSGFAMRSGKQTLLYLPLAFARMQEVVENGVTPYFAQRAEAEKPKQPETVEQPQEEKAPLFEIPDNNMRFAETADLLGERDLTVAFASTETIVYIQNGVRSNPTFGASFIPAAIKDDPSSRASVTERIACLADGARREIGTTLGAAISNIYSLGMDSKEMFLHVALTDGENANVRKITAQPGMTTGDLVAFATDTLYTMLQDYAEGEAFPPEDADVKPLKLYEESAQSARANQKRKRSTAIQIAVCVVIALILCVLIGFYFKDEVAAFFDSASDLSPAAAVVNIEPKTEPLTEAFLEETTVETEPYTAEDVDLALFGTAAPAATTKAQTEVFVETPAPQSVELEITPYLAPTTTTKATTTAPVTTTKAATTTTTTTTTTKPAETTTKAAAKAVKSEEKEDVSEKDAESTKATTTGQAAESTTKAATTTTTTKATTTTTTTTTTKSSLAGLALLDKQNVKFNFTVYGYGHGVGMSQLGALAYSQKGWSYKEILYHYYPGTTLTSETPPATVTYCGKTRDMEDFMIRVVQQEIGGYCKSGDEEALKAQAVAAYSYMKVRKYTLSSGDVACSTIADSKLSPLVKSAVKSVLGEYLTYGGSPISAQFYASSAGKTTSAESVWGGKYPYLAGGVESIETVSVSTCSISAADFKELIDAYNRANPNKKITLSDDPTEWIEILAHDGARGNVGYVTSIRVGDKTMNGNTFRTIFNSYRKSGTAGLKSHCFSFTVG